MDDLLEQLKQKPGLKLLVNELTRFIEEEENLRNEFYNRISENDKAEFINGEIIFHSPVKWEHAGTTRKFILLTTVLCC